MRIYIVIFQKKFAQSTLRQSKLRVEDNKPCTDVRHANFYYTLVYKVITEIPYILSGSGQGHSEVVMKRCVLSLELKLVRESEGRRLMEDPRRGGTKISNHTSLS